MAKYKKNNIMDDTIVGYTIGCKCRSACCAFPLSVHFGRVMRQYSTALGDQADIARHDSKGEEISYGGEIYPDRPLIEDIYNKPKFKVGEMVYAEDSIGYIEHVKVIEIIGDWDAEDECIRWKYHTLLTIEDYRYNATYEEMNISRRHRLANVPNQDILDDFRIAIVNAKNRSTVTLISHALNDFSARKAISLEEYNIVCRMIDIRYDEISDGVLPRNSIISTEGTELTTHNPTNSNSNPITGE